jgi:hypothetical protein
LPRLKANDSGTNNPRAEKTEVFVVDPVEELVPMLTRMVAKRRRWGKASDARPGVS